MSLTLFSNAFLRQQRYKMSKARNTSNPLSHLPVKPFMHCKVRLHDCESSSRYAATSASSPQCAVWKHQSRMDCICFKWVHNMTTGRRKWNQRRLIYELWLCSSRSVIKWRIWSSVLNKDSGTCRRLRCSRQSWFTAKSSCCAAGFATEEATFCGISL